MTCISEINTCTFIPHVHQSTGRTSQEALDDLDMSFSDPVDEPSSDAESFDEDDMYGLGHGMEVISESSDDEDEADMLQSSEERMVCRCVSKHVLISEIVVG
jgi:hypothetical protein